jgi:SAM-dependent methyltransferase
MNSYWDEISATYTSAVITPFYNAQTTQALVQALQELSPSTGRTLNHIVEVGCGNGYLLPHLRARHLTALDLSAMMLQNAKNNAGIASLLQADQAALPLRPRSAQEVYAINSILDPDRDHRMSTLKEIHQLLDTDGVFIGLFPSNENYLEQAYAFKEKEIATGVSEDQALHTTYRMLVKRQFDPLGGFIDVTEDWRMKLYWNYELADHLRAAGFANVTIKKFTYPSCMQEELQLLCTENGIYDWLVKAERTS